jgi:hypothetical protein
MRSNTDPTTVAGARHAGGLIPRLRATWRSRPGYFARHYTEMVAAMFLGMAVLGVPLTGLLGVAGVDVSDWRTDARELMLLGMAFTMSVPMAAWMRFRGHAWAPVWEMSAAMFIPSFLAIGLLWAGSVENSGTLLAIQHVGMFPGMLAAMLLRLDEYTGHGRHAHATA